MNLYQETRHKPRNSLSKDNVQKLGLLARSAWTELNCPELKCYFPANPMSLLFETTDVERELVFGDLRQGLVRLDTVTTNRVAMKPDDKIRIALLYFQGADEREIEQRIDLSSQTVKKCARDVKVVMVRLRSKHFSQYSELDLNEEESRRYAQLIKLEDEAQRIKTILSDRTVGKALSDLPHLQALLETYQMFSTVKPLLESVGLAYSEQEIQQANAAVRGYLFFDKPGRIFTLTRKIVLSKFMHDTTNWYGKHIEKTICEYARLLYITKGAPAYRKLARVLFYCLLKEEYDILRADPSVKSTELALYYPLLKAELTESDMPGIWEECAKLEICPTTLLNMIRMYLKGERVKTIARNLKGDLVLGQDYRAILVAAGLRFVENILLTKNNNISEDILDIDRMKQMQIVRQAIRKVHKG